MRRTAPTGSFDDADGLFLDLLVPEPDGDGKPKRPRWEEWMRRSRGHRPSAKKVDDHGNIIAGIADYRRTS